MKTPQTNLRLTESARRKLQDICYEARVGPSVAASAALDIVTVEGVVDVLRASGEAGEAGRPGTVVEVSVNGTSPGETIFVPADPKAAAEQMLDTCALVPGPAVVFVHPLVWFAARELLRGKLSAVEEAAWDAPVDPRCVGLFGKNLTVMAVPDAGPLGWNIKEPA